MQQEKENFYYEEDEISLYDIIDILIKYKKLIISVFLIGFLLSIGAALVFRNWNRKEIAKQDFLINYAPLENNEYYKMVGLTYTKYNPKEILQKESYIDKFLEIEELKQNFENAKTDNENLELERKIKFLSNIITLTENKDSYTITVTTEKKLNISSKVVEVFFNILEENTSSKLNKLITSEKERALLLNKEAFEKLESIKVEISEILKNERSLNLTTSDMSALIAFKEPRLAADNTFYQGIYDTTSKKIIGAENLLKTDLLNEIVQKSSSLIISNKSGIAKYVLLGGLVFTFFAIFMIVIFKECSEGYRKHKYEKEQKKLLQ